MIDESNVSEAKNPVRAPHIEPPRIQPLATLPVFFKTAGRRIVLAGETEAVGWKAELLAAAGADVHIFAENPVAKIQLLADASDTITLHLRRWMPSDLSGAIMAIADAADERQAEAFSAAARAAGIPVNVVDRPDYCDFQFGSIVNRSPLVVAISTDGAAPVFGQALRAKIETLLPQGFSAWAQAARRWRAGIAALELDFRGRRTFWERFTALALARPDTPPQETDRADLIAQTTALRAHPLQARGKVLLVGAGPGDPELLTLRAVRALQSADVIVFDDLVSQGVLDMARREAERLNVGKRGYKPSCGQDEISALLVNLALEGKTVVRLKGGDPAIFGRANEEIEALRHHDVAVEIIPGVTAAAGAAASLGVSMTERDLARRVQFVTAHARDGRLPEDLNWNALADPGATTAIYMGVRTLSALIDKLLAAGADPSTPAIMVERATWPDERVIASTLSAIVARVSQEPVRGPCIVLVGAALGKAARNHDKIP